MAAWWTLLSGATTLVQILAAPSRKDQTHRPRRVRSMSKGLERAAQAGIGMGGFVLTAILIIGILMRRPEVLKAFQFLEL